MFIIYGILSLTLIYGAIYSGYHIFKTYFTHSDIQFIEEE